MQEIPYGYCHCGCGNKTKLIENNGHVRLDLVNTPRKYIFGHTHIGKNRELNNNWKGGKIKDRKGYVRIYLPQHPKSNSTGHVAEHVLVCEMVLGKYLPDGAVPHHIDEVKDNNIPTNFVICQDDNYHKLLHKRMRALRECGHANWVKCQFCKQYDKPENVVRRGNSSTFHQSCYNSYLRKYSKLRYHRKGG